MAGKRTEWEFTGDASDLVKELDRIIKGLKELKKTAVATTESLDAVAKEGKKTADSQKDLTTATKSLAQQLTSLGHLIHAVAGPRSALAGMANKMIELGGASQRLSGAAGLGGVAVALAPMAGVLLITAASILTFGAAVAAVTEFMISAVFEAEELNDKIEKLGGAGGLEVLSADELDTIQTVTASVEALEAAWDAVKLTIAANVAPQLEQLSIALVTVSLAAVDNFKIWAEGKNILVEFAQVVAEAVLVVVGSLGPLSKVLGVAGTAAEMLALKGLKKLADGLIDLGTTGAADTLDDLIEGMGEYHTKAIEIIGRIKELNAAHKNKKDIDTYNRLMKQLGKQFETASEQAERLQDQVKSLGQQALKPNLDAVELLTLKYDNIKDSLQGVIDTTIENSRALIKEAQAAEAAGASEDVLNSALEAIHQNMIANIGAREGLTAATKEQAEATEELREKLQAAADVKANRDFMDSMRALSNESGNFVERLASVNKEIERLADLEAQGIDTSEEMNAALKARTSILEDMAHAAAATATFMADMFGSAIDLIMLQNDELTEQQKNQIMVLYRAQQAAAIVSIIISALVAATKALELGPIVGPPAAALMIAAGSINAGIVAATPPPEFHVGGIIPQGASLVSALPGESILNRETTAQLGAGGVADLNSGGAGGTMVIEQVYGHRVFNRFIVDNLASGGPLKQEILGNTRVGHRVRSTA